MNVKYKRTYQIMSALFVWSDYFFLPTILNSPKKLACTVMCYVNSYVVRIYESWPNQS